MLTTKENLHETMYGGTPDRFVNQYKFLHLIWNDPYNLHDPNPVPGQMDVVNSWGYTQSWPKGFPGMFPVHDEKHLVIKDIEHWQDYVKAPNLKFSSAEWEPAQKEAEEVDRDEQYIAPFIAPGTFERCHYLLEIQNFLIDFYTNPDELKDLIKYLTEWELEYAEELCTHLHPDALFHHDDWGSQNSTFISPAMFEEFFLDAYNEIYGYYRAHGVKLIVHHSDSYTATFVPYMIEMGIDIWQGVMKSNDIKSLITQYGGKLTFMGGIDSATVDFSGWTKEAVRKEVHNACSEYGKLYYIPNSTIGKPSSIYPGVYSALTDAINQESKLQFAND